MLDYFSSTSRVYSFSRPVYPNVLYTYLSSITPNKDLAWDCATGNGQAAIGLCKYFKNVIASDASKSQLEYHFDRDNIKYEIFPAEKTHLKNNSVDLITVAQAAHWLNLDEFYKEVTRIGKNNGVIAIWSYGMHKIESEIDNVCDRLNVDGDILGRYWPKEIIYVKEGYRTIPFPFKEIAPPKFEMSAIWNLYNLVNYMQTWSATQRFIAEEKYNPLNLVVDELEKLWRNPDKQKVVKWDINFRVGKIKNKLCHMAGNTREL